MEKKKVLFITPSLCHGGIERSQVIMLQLLDKTKYELTLFLYVDDLTLLPLVPDEVRVVVDKETPHYYRRPKAMLLYALAKAAKLTGRNAEKRQEALRTYIHAQKVRHPAKDLFCHDTFNVVVSNAIGICTEMALQIPAKKHIVWYRASVDMHHEMLTRLLPQYEDVIAVSAGVRQMLSHQYPMISDKIQVINNYVDYREVAERAEKPCDISIVPERLSICTCGRFTREKGFDMAVAAAGILKKNGLRFVWYFIGDGEDRIKLEQQIAQLGLEREIVITGFTDNPFPLMKRCDIYVQPSYEESFGRTIKEALILGRPVVSTDTAGGREILKDGGYGIITSIDANGLAKGILEVRGAELQPYTEQQNQKEKKDFIDAMNRIFYETETA